MTDNAQPEALRLAALIEKTGARGSLRDQAGAELRRLHAENETLRMGYAAARLEIESLKAQSADATHGEHAELRRLSDCCPELNLSNYGPDDVDELNGWAIEVSQCIDRALAAQPAGAPQPGAAYAALPYKQALGSTNCMQCCVSYMMGLPLENVPDFATYGGWERFSDFAETQGYVAVMLPGNREYEADYLASGTTARGTSHMVVMNDGKLVHDPHPSNAGLVDVQCVWLLAKRASPTQGQQDEHTAFEASAKTYTSNVSFERDASDYVDMTASLLWHGWKLRASHGQPYPTIDDLCARIKAADDAAADRDYMLDSNDCIAILRGEWKGPLAMDKPERASHGQAPASKIEGLTAAQESLGVEFEKVLHDNLFDLYEESAPHVQAPAQAAPAYKDSTFESWYSSYNPTHKGDKQRARDAYAAGMGDPLVMAGPTAVAGPSEAVAYLDIGAGGYLDLGTDLTDEALSRLPKGRHALVIAGTYGIDGYIAAPTAQPAPRQEAQEPMAWHEQARAIREGNEIAASDKYFSARPQIVSADRRKVFQAGFERGWDAARAAQEGANHG